jgi:hypothetical protein
MSNKRIVLSVVGWSLVLCATVFAQGPGGTLTGTVEDASRALIPGVTITNEAGAYNLPTAAVTGFQAQTVNGIESGKYGGYA